MNEPLRSRAEWALSVVLALLAMAVFAVTRPISVTPVLRLDLYKNAVAIANLDQPRQVVRQATHWVDILDLARDGQLAHPRLGVLGLGEHYFLDLDTRIQVAKTGSFRFEVSSDDGFALEIDDRRICAFTRDRALVAQTCTSLLLAGEHHLRLRYFQGGGPAGLSVRYAAGEGDWSWLGQDSAQLRFVGP